MQKDHGEDPVMTDDAKAGSSLAELTAEIVSAYVAHNQIASSEVAKLITVVAGELNKIGSEVEPPTEGKAEPAVSVRRSIRPDHLVCLICGRKQKLLKRHLAVEHELTPNQYRETFGLKSDYPMAAPNYAQQRREFAVKIGLGRPKKPARRRRNSTPGSTQPAVAKTHS